MFRSVERKDEALEGLDIEVLNEEIPHGYCRHAQIMPNGVVRCNLIGKFVKCECGDNDYDYNRYLQDMENKYKDER